MLLFSTRNFGIRSMLPIFNCRFSQSGSVNSPPEPPPSSPTPKKDRVWPQFPYFKPGPTRNQFSSTNPELRAVTKTAIGQRQSMVRAPR